MVKMRLEQLTTNTSYSLQ